MMTGSPSTSIPRHVVQQRHRPVAAGIPPTAAERTRMLMAARQYVAEFNPVPPLPLDELTHHASVMLEWKGGDHSWRDYVAVLLNNEMWRETLATVPYQRRLLLLPKCLRVESKCQGQFDEFGLLCRQCGLCTIQDLQAEAEQLGYAVLVAEGSQIVMSLVQTGRIDAIVGVSCLDVLGKAFPYMEAAAIPGAAVPLLQDDCRDTTVDMDWVWDYIHLSSADQTRRLDLGGLRHNVECWFALESLDELLGSVESDPERIARDWLAKAGKRWRPFLAAAAFQALRADPGASIPDHVRQVAVAIECFHKASLIHDDIEDDDNERYGEKTVHLEHGVPVALNAGDLLIGEGYRLLATCDLPLQQKSQMLRIAAEGQRQLCQGQGTELSWGRTPTPLNSLQVLDIFRRKTAPAFEVALKLGTLCACSVFEGAAQPAAGAGQPSSNADNQYAELAPLLRRYSEALGIAYQIRDDLADLGVNGQDEDLAAHRPSLLLAIAYERASGDNKALLDAWWRRRPPHGVDAAQIATLCVGLGADSRARTLLATYQEEAIRSLRGFGNASLKGLLRRTIGKIFNEIEIKGWCRELQERRIAARAAKQLA